MEAMQALQEIQQVNIDSKYENVVMNIENSQLMYVKNISGNQKQKKITYQIDSGWLNLDQCGMILIFDQRCDNPTVQIARLNNVMMSGMKECIITIDGVVKAHYNDLTFAQNLYWQSDVFKKQEQHGINVAAPYNLQQLDFQIITVGTQNAIMTNLSHAMSFKHFFPFVFKDCEYIKINNSMQIQITLDYNSPNIGTPGALEGYGVNNDNETQQFESGDTMEIQYKQLQMVLQKYDPKIEQLIKQDNDFINNVDQTSFTDYKINFQINRPMPMKRQLFYIKKTDLDNLATMNQYTSTDIVGADIQQNSLQLVFAKTYQDVFAQFQLWQLRKNSNQYIIDTQLPLQTVSYNVDLKLGANLTFEVGVLSY